MALIETIHSILEACTGRKALWRISRKLYLLSRRDGSLDHRTNGEFQLIELLAQSVAQKGQQIVAFDVGANYGEWISMLLDAAQRHSVSNVVIHAFEPVSHLAESLRASTTSHSLNHKLKIMNVALSKEPGRLKFVYTSNKGDHHLASEDYAFKGETIYVDVTTLDIYSSQEGIDRIDIIKIDAEGFDMFVIEGGRGLIEREAVDIVQFEYSSLFIRTRSYLYDAFELIRGTRYRVGRLTAKGVEVFEAWHHDLERFYGTNYVLIHERAMIWAKARRVEIDATNAYS